MDIRQCVAKNLIRLRKEAGMSQEQLAAKAGISFTTISRFENGRQFPKEKNIKAIAKALNVDELKLFLTENQGQKASPDENLREAMQALLEIRSPAQWDTLRVTLIGLGVLAEHRAPVTKSSRRK